MCPQTSKCHIKAPRRVTTKGKRFRCPDEHRQCADRICYPRRYDTTRKGNVAALPAAKDEPIVDPIPASEKNPVSGEEQERREAEALKVILRFAQTLQQKKKDLKAAHVLADQLKKEAEKAKKEAEEAEQMRIQREAEAKPFRERLIEFWATQKARVAERHALEAKVKAEKAALEAQIRSQKAADMLKTVDEADVAMRRFLELQVHAVKKPSRKEGNILNMIYMNKQKLTLAMIRKLKVPPVVTLVVFIHGRMNFPFQTPVAVERRLATDFGTFHYAERQKLGTQIQEIMNDKTRSDESVRSYINELLLHNPARDVFLKDNRQGERKLFAESKHHGKPKMFAVNAPMMDKVYGSLDDGHVVFVKAKEFLMEIKPNRGYRFSLSNLLGLLSSLGVKKTFLYDFSCSGSGYTSYAGTRESDYKLFGGD